jgi:hypothetical protein
LWERRQYAFHWIQQHRGYGFEPAAPVSLTSWVEQFMYENREQVLLIWPMYFVDQERDCAAGYCNHGQHWSRKYQQRAKKRKTAVDVLLQRC